MVRIRAFALVMIALLVLTPPPSVLAAGAEEENPEALARERLAEADATHGPESLQSADAIDVLVRLLWKQRKTKEPETVALAERAVRNRTAKQPGSPELAGSLYVLATITRINGDYKGALPIYEKAQKIQERFLPAEAAGLGDTLNGMGTSLHRLGRLEDAERAYEQSIALLSQANGEEHETVALVLGNLANVYRDQDRLDEAIRLQEKALAIREQAFGPESREVIANVSGLANALASADDRVRAKELFERELALSKKHYGDDSVVTAQAHQHLAVIEELLGDYPSALVHAERAVAIDSKAVGTAHATFASDLNTLASIRAAMGHLEESRDLYARARSIWSQALGPDHPRTAQATANLGRVEHELGHDELARPLLEEALAAQEKALGPDALEAAFSLSDLSEIASDAGDFHAARRDAQRALDIRTKHLGAESPLAATSMGHLAEAFAGSGETARAKELFVRAAQVQERTLGPSHPDLAATLAGLAGVLWKRGESSEALETALRAERIGREHLRETASVLPERDALRYDAIRASGSSIALAVTVDHPTPEAARATWDAVVRSRALVLDEMAERHRTVVGAKDVETARLAMELESARRRLAGLIVRGTGENAAGDSAHIEDARRARDDAERALAERGVSTREQRDAERIGFAEVDRALPETSAIVSFVAFTHPERGPEYLAFVKRAGSAPLLVVGLGARAAIDSAVAQWNRAVRASAHATKRDEARAANDARARGAALRELVWTPIEPQVRGARRLFFVPDAALHLASFAALPIAESDFLLDRVETIHYAAAERDLAFLAEAPANGPTSPQDGMLVVGGPRFDEPSLFAALDRSKTAVVASSALPGSMPLRGALPDCPELATLRFAPLPGSSREARDVGSIWKSAKRGPVVRLEGADASEPRVKASAPGNHVLHFATHSFVLDASCRAPLASGLALAGANLREAAGEDEEDGILTAEEIASLDLSSAQWAVLSSCESGAGESIAGEGVFGLRRAFRVAGARTILMTLWPVDDDSAREWIRELYAARLDRGLTTDRAASAASRAVLDRLRSKGEIPHPFLWGNFLAAGDWR